MNIIEISFIICATFSCCIFCDICIQDIKEKYEKKKKSSYEPLINASELTEIKDTPEGLTSEEEIREILRH
tara:strand:- start:4035 stop:4247 length:213 start_codon:yes stop_codon:yes gene_type:complete